MKFTKMHGCGNDYVYVNGFEEQVQDEAAAAVYVSDRHFGIGADGLIFIKPSEIADFQMVMYNADGSRSEMCGNGIRCVAKYVYDNKLTDKTLLTIESMGKVKTIRLFAENGSVREATVDMGAPVLESERVPVVSDHDRVICEDITVDGEEYKMTCVSMGNPHCVVFRQEDVQSLDLMKIGPAFETHPRFPKKVNAEFVRVLDRTTLDMRVWERGTGETLACGTGSCAAAVAAILNGFCDHDITVRLPGGALKISWSGRMDDGVKMTGPATTVFSGEIALPEENR